MTARAETARIADALERIAAALERTADADPLTMLQAAIAENDAGAPGAPWPRPSHQGGLAGNGLTVIYRHPNPEWEIVARRDARAEGGYVVSVERADGR